VEPPAAAGTVAEQRAAEAMRERAHRYAPPMAWDDGQIDLPDGKPADGWRRGKDTTHRW
jgi:hypothetical protein